MPSEGKIAGVCAGIAQYFHADVAFVRLAWVVLSILPGALIGGMIAYGVAWFLMPKAASAADRPAVARLVRSRTDRKIAGVCGGLAEYLGVDATIVRVAWAVLTFVPGAIVCGLLAYLVAWLILPSAPAPTMQESPSTA